MKCKNCKKELDATNSDFQIAFTLQLCEDCDTQENRKKYFSDELKGGQNGRTK